MRYRRPPNADRQSQPIRTISARRDPQIDSAPSRAAPRLSFGQPRIIIDRHKVGTHAGLPHIEAVVLKDGRPVALADVHLHHNVNHLSVGVTLHFYTQPVFPGGKATSEVQV